MPWRPHPMCAAVVVASAVPILAALPAHGIELAAEVPATAPVGGDFALILPPAGFPDDLAAQRYGPLLERVRALGLTAVVAGRGKGITLETGYNIGCGVGFEAAAADRERIAALLRAADELGLRVFLDGFEVTRNGADLGPAEQAPLVEMAVTGALRSLTEHGSLAGFLWRVPAPAPVPPDARPDVAEKAIRDWSDGVQRLATVCGKLCAASGTSFVVVTAEPVTVAAALATVPEGVQVWCEGHIGRDPTLAAQYAALSASVHGQASGVWLRMTLPTPRSLARAALMAISAGCRTVVVDNALALTSWPGGEMARALGDLSQFAVLAEASGRAGMQADRSADVTLLVEPATQLSRLVRPDGFRSQVLPALATLNDAGRSVAIAVEPPAAGQGAVLLCDGARASDAFIDRVLDAADRGLTAIVFADVATESAIGGARVKESRDRQASRLPFDRTRPFQETASRLRVTQDLRGTEMRRGRELEVRQLAAQGIWRGSARAGTEALAEWVEAGAPAFVLSPRGAGRVLVLNGLPSLTRSSILGAVLTHVGVPTTRPETVAKPEARRSGERETLDRHGLIREEPYVRPEPVQVLAPSDLGPGVAESQAAYDAFIAGPVAQLFALGYRSPTGRPAFAFGPVEARMGAWDFVALSGDAVLTSASGMRIPGGRAVSAHLGDGSYGEVVYRPGGGDTECTRGGLFRFVRATAAHALVDAGGAQVVAAHTTQGGGLRFEVDRPATLRVQLDEDSLAGKRVAVWLAPAGDAAPVPLGSAQWWVTADGVLMVDALAHMPVEVGFSETDEDAGRAALDLASAAGAAWVELDGGPCLILDRYQNASVVISFEHWGAPGQRTLLSLTGVRAGVDGEGQPGSDAPARLRVLMNGQEVYAADAPLRVMRSDGSRAEWTSLAIPVRREYLRRGVNEVTIENHGPGAVALAAGTVSYEDAARDIPASGAGGS